MSPLSSKSAWNPYPKPKEDGVHCRDLSAQRKLKTTTSADEATTANPVRRKATGNLRKGLKPIKIEAVRYLQLTNVWEYFKETLSVIIKTASAMVTRQSHKDTAFQHAFWRSTLQCWIAFALARMMVGARETLLLGPGSIIFSSIATLIVATCMLQQEAIRLIIKGVGLRRIESLVTVATADVFWSDQDGTLTEKSKKSIRWEHAVPLAPYSLQDLQDTIALAMGSTGFKGRYKERMIPPRPLANASGLVSSKYLKNGKTGSLTFMAVGNPCAAIDYNPLRPRLSTKGAQAMFQGIGEFDDCRQLQKVVNNYFKTGQACHVVVTAFHDPKSERPCRLRAVGAYPVHSPVLRSSKRTIAAIESHGMKFRLATAASQSYAQLVGRALQTPMRQLHHAPLLEAKASVAVNTRENRTQLIREVIDSSGGITNCDRLAGGKALLMNAAREERHTTIMFGDGFNDVEAMRAADVGIGAGLHSYWMVVTTADILIGTHTSKQSIESLPDLMDGAAAATSSVLRYLEGVRLTQQMLATVAAWRHFNHPTYVIPSHLVLLTAIGLPFFLLYLSSLSGPLTRAELTYRMRFDQLSVKRTGAYVFSSASTLVTSVCSLIGRASASFLESYVSQVTRAADRIASVQRRAAT